MVAVNSGEKRGCGGSSGGYGSQCWQWGRVLGTMLPVERGNGGQCKREAVMAVGVFGTVLAVGRGSGGQCRREAVLAVGVWGVVLAVGLRGAVLAVGGMGATLAVGGMGHIACSEGVREKKRQGKKEEVAARKEEA